MEQLKFLINEIINHRKWRTSSAYGVETVIRSDHPIILWASLAVYLILADVIMRLGGAAYAY